MNTVNKRRSMMSLPWDVKLPWPTGSITTIGARFHFLGLYAIDALTERAGLTKYTIRLSNAYYKITENTYYSMNLNSNHHSIVEY
jgi:hypothetical protein